MRIASKLLFAVAGCVWLSGCALIAPNSASVVEAAAAEDAAFCRSNGGPPGSNEYAACMKERDLARGEQERRLDRAHQRMVDGMLNGH